MDEKLREYKLLKLLGEGGMGSVYLAREEPTERAVAIKILHPQLIANPQFKERFLREAKVLSQLNHPNISGLLTLFEEDNKLCTVMQYIEGETIKSMIKRRGPIPETEVRNILLQILDAVDYAHQKEIIHRDIKPSNILIDSQNKVSLLDFGIAKIVEDVELTKTGSMLGTLYYMSPEQIKGEKDIDLRTDIYSIGVTAYEMLAGRLPFETVTEISEYQRGKITHKIVHEDFPNPKEYYPYISDEIIKLVQLMLKRERNERPDDCRDCKKFLGEKDKLKEYPPIDNEQEKKINRSDNNKKFSTSDRVTEKKENKESAKTNLSQIRPEPKKSKAKYIFVTLLIIIAVASVLFFTQFRYEKYDYYSGYARVYDRVTGKWGLIDNNDNFFIRPIYDKIFGFADGLTKIYHKGRYGFFIPENEKYVKPKYDYLDNFIGDYAQLKLSDEWGALDRNGDEFVIPNYESIKIYEDGFIKLKKDGKWGFFNREEKIFDYLTISEMNTLLVYGIEENDYSIVHTLLRLGADPNYKLNSNDSQILLHAIYEGASLDIIKLLVGYGAAPNPKTNVYRWDEERGEGGWYGSSIVLAAGEGRLDVAKYLMNSCNVSVNDIEFNPKTNEYGWTPLMSASYWGHLDIVEFLIENNADINIQSKVDNYTALDYARSRNYFGIISILENNGAISKKVLSKEKLSSNVIDRINSMGYDYGKTIFFDNFHDNSNTWNFTDQKTGKYLQIINGELHAQSKDGYSQFFKINKNTEHRNFVLKFKLKYISGEYYYSSAGIYFREKSDNYYCLTFDAEGTCKYELNTYSSSKEWETILDNETSYLRGGEANIIEVIVVDNYMYLYFNNKYVISYDKIMNSLGESFGILMSSDKTRYSFDDIIMVELK